MSESITKNEAIAARTVLLQNLEELNLDLEKSKNVKGVEIGICLIVDRIKYLDEQIEKL
jgi:hypothetical protein